MGWVVAHQIFGLEIDHPHPPHRLHATRAQALTEVVGSPPSRFGGPHLGFRKSLPQSLSDPIFPYLRYYHVSLDLLLRLQFHFSIVQNHVDFASFVGFRGRFSLPLHVVLCACTHGSVVDCLSLSNYRFRAVI
jgi:hypothetical protein